VALGVEPLDRSTADIGKEDTAVGGTDHETSRFADRMVGIFEQQGGVDRGHPGRRRHSNAAAGGKEEHTHAEWSKHQATPLAARERCTLDLSAGSQLRDSWVTA